MTNVKKVARTLTGRVVSDVRDKTRKVEVPSTRLHPIYGKVIKSRTMLHIHDPENQSKLGDLVEIIEVRPISKTKNWQLVQILENAQ